MAKKFFVLSLFACLCVFSTAKAAEFIAAPKGQPNITLGASETHKNLYAAGGSVNVNSATLGDLYVAGGTINADGPVEQDSSIAGGTVTTSGTIGGDLRIGGGNITVNSAVGGDVLVGGGNITISDKSNVGGDLVIGGGNVVVDAPVKGNVKIGGGNIIINSKIDGTVDVQSTQKLTFGPKAEISGKINHKGVSQASVDPQAKISPINYTQIQGGHAAKNRARGLLTVAFLIKLVAWIIAAWLLLRFWRYGYSRVEEGVRKHPWENLAIGLASIIIIPIVVGILFITFIGYYLAFVILVMFALLVLLALLAGALILGSLIVRWLSRTSVTIPDWQIVLIGVVAWFILSLIPIVGWLINFVLFIMGFGALVRLVWENAHIKRQAT